MASTNPSITPDDLIRRVDGNDAPGIVDVRSAAEFERGHVPGAVNVPFNLVRKRSTDIPAAPDDELVVYCGHGPRAYLAAAALRRLGWRRIRYLRGHWAGWKRAGLRAES